MSDTLVNVRSRVRRRLDETTARFWQDQDLNDWINEGAREIARRAEILQSTSTINTVAGTQQYTLPTDVLRVHRVEWSRQGVFSATAQVTPLEYRDFNNMDSIWWSSQRTSRGDPYWYTMWGFPPSLSLVVYPTPDASVTDGLKLFYYRIPAAATVDASVVEVPAGWDDLIIDYCEYSALRKDADQRWQEAKQLFEDKMNHMIDTTRHWTDQAGTFNTGTTPLPRWIWDADYY